MNFEVRQNAEYETEIRQFAVSLHFLSPAAYIFVHEFMGGFLPTLSTIRMWSDSIKLNPGLIDISFEHLRAMSEVNVHDKGDKSVVNIKRIRAAISFGKLFFSYDLSIHFFFFSLLFQYYDDIIMLMHCSYSSFPK